MRVSKMYKQTMLPNEQVEVFGAMIIDLLHLKVDKSGCVKTSFGKKTALGLGHTLVNLVEAQYVDM